jgi:hypothetical protein
MANFLIGVFIFLLVSPVILTIISGLTYFYTRDFYPQLFVRVFTWTWNKDIIDTNNACSKYHNHDDYATGLWFISLMLYTVIACVLGLTYSKYGSVGLMSLATFTLVAIAPRYILDLCKALKYNTKTRDSDRLVKLEEEIQKLKNR